MSGVQKVVHRQDGVVRVAKDQNRSSVEILQFRFNSCGMEHFSRRRLTTIVAPSVSYSVHEVKYCLFQLFLHHFIS